MTIRDEYEVKTIGILTTRGPEPATCWTRGDFAVRDVMGEGYAEVIHMVSGTALPVRFSQTDAALRFAKDLQRLRNDWTVFDPRAMSDAFRRQVRGLIERHHGTFYGNRKLSQATAPIFDAAMAQRQRPN
jgi:hypothetical protein